jgi:hypothetical protein
MSPQKMAKLLQVVYGRDHDYWFYYQHFTSVWLKMSLSCGRNEGCWRVIPRAWLLDPFILTFQPSCGNDYTPISTIFITWNLIPPSCIWCLKFFLLSLVNGSYTSQSRSPIRFQKSTCHTIKCINSHTIKIIWTRALNFQEINIRY